MKAPFPPSELVLTPEGAVYHLNLHAHQIAETVLLVGDPGRVLLCAELFDTREEAISHREFTTVTGTFNGKRISAMSTGIGTDNIDIALNELDALANINLRTRQVNSTHKSLRLVRVGTCGCLLPGVEPGTPIVSRYALGFDPLHIFYGFKPAADVQMAVNNHRPWPENLPRPYAASGDAHLTTLLEKSTQGLAGITLTAPGFYAPQGRSLRLPAAFPGINELFDGFAHNGLQVANWEMETSALYALGNALGHQCATVCLTVANRPDQRFLTNYTDKMRGLLQNVLTALAS